MTGANVRCLMNRTEKVVFRWKNLPASMIFASGISVVAIGFLMVYLKDSKINYSAYVHLHKGYIYI